MAAYTLTTTPAQDDLLAYVVAKANAERETNLTVEQYIAVRFPELLAPYAEAFKQSVRQQLATAYSAADAATKQQVKTLLGIA